MAKRQIWLTEDEAELATRVCDFALERITARLNHNVETERFALMWTKSTVTRLRAKFAAKDNP